jgi:hypothetical protein
MSCARLDVFPARLRHCRNWMIATASPMASPMMPAAIAAAPGWIIPTIATANAGIGTTTATITAF